jgi:hypothetical protein
MLAKLIVAAELFIGKNREPLLTSGVISPRRVDTVKHLFTNVHSTNKARNTVPLLLLFFLFNDVFNNSDYI